MEALMSQLDINSLDGQSTGDGSTSVGGVEDDHRPSAHPRIHMTGFPVYAGYDLWSSCTSSMVDFRHGVMRNGVLAVAVDALPPDPPEVGSSHGVVELGLAYLPPQMYTGIRKFSHPPNLLDTVHRYFIRCRTIDIIGGRRDPSLDKEQYDYGSGTPDRVSTRDVEDHVVGILRGMARERRNKPILVGFGMGSDFSAVTERYPGILNDDYFSSWVDIQALGHEVPRIRHGRDPGDGEPTMDETLRALGYVPPKATCDKRRRRAGNDAAGILGIVLGMLAQNDMPELRRRREGLIGEACTRSNVNPAYIQKYWHYKPEPPELYPWMARVEVLGVKGSPLMRNEWMLYYFAMFGPIAVGKGRENGSLLPTCDYLCFNSIFDLAKFIISVNGSRMYPTYNNSPVWSVGLDEDREVLIPKSFDEDLGGNECGLTMKLSTLIEIMAMFPTTFM